MASLRWGIIAASAALVISVLLGIISEVRPLFIVLRALIFVILFFGVGMGLRMIIQSVFPELLSLNEEPVIHEGSQPGERVNVTVGNTGEYAVPEMYEDADHRELGNIEDLISGAFKPHVVEASPDHFMQSAGGGIDGKGDFDYNNQGEGQDTSNSDIFDFPSAGPSAGAPPSKQVFTPSTGDDAAGLGGLLDLETMATAFSAGGESRLSVAQAQSSNEGLMEPIDGHLLNDAPLVSSKPVSKSGKSQELEGDFNPKELAMGIRTVLSKDK